MLQLYEACAAWALCVRGWGSLPSARQARGGLAALHLQHLKKPVGLRRPVTTPTLL